MEFVASHTNFDCFPMAKEKQTQSAVLVKINGIHLMPLQSVALMVLGVFCSTKDIISARNRWGKRYSNVLQTRD